MTKPARSPELAPRKRVLLADDHAILRQGLAMLVSAEPDLEVVGQATGGREAVRLARELQPDIVVLDVSMPDLGGAEAAEQIKAERSATLVLALTRHDDQGYLRRMLKAGTVGYVTKRAAADTLIDAIRNVLDGGHYIDPALSAGLIAGSFHRSGFGGLTEPGARAPLSQREEQVLRLIAWGKSNKEVGAQLGISAKTAEFYKACAVEKLHLRSRTDVLRYALANHWMDADNAPE